jgi:hypothetical protein
MNKQELLEEVRKFDEMMDFVRPFLRVLAEAAEQNLEFEDTMLAVEGTYKSLRTQLIRDNAE